MAKATTTTGKSELGRGELEVFRVSARERSKPHDLLGPCSIICLSNNDKRAGGVRQKQSDVDVEV